VSCCRLRSRFVFSDRERERAAGLVRFASVPCSVYGVLSCVQSFPFRVPCLLSLSRTRAVALSPFPSVRSCRPVRRPSFVCRRVCASVLVLVCPSFRSVRPSVRPSVRLSVRPSVCLSVCLSVCVDNGLPLATQCKLSSLVLLTLFWAPFGRWLRSADVSAGRLQSGLSCWSQLSPSSAVSLRRRRFALDLTRWKWAALFDGWRRTEWKGPRWTSVATSTGHWPCSCLMLN